VRRGESEEEGDSKSLGKRRWRGQCERAFQKNEFRVSSWGSSKFGICQRLGDFEQAAWVTQRKTILLSDSRPCMSNLAPQPNADSQPSTHITSPNREEPSQTYTCHCLHPVPKSQACFIPGPGQTRRRPSCLAPPSASTSPCPLRWWRR
jgi:hypothetical protein